MQDNDRLLVSESEASRDGWSPQSPFVVQAEYDHPPAEKLDSESPLPTWRRIETPFVGFYEIGEIGDGRLQEAELYAALHDELTDPEFEEAIEGLVQVASDTYNDRLLADSEATSTSGLDAIRSLHAQFTPLAFEAEMLLEAIARQADNHESFSEVELETALEQPVERREHPNPAFEFFLKKLANKARGAIKAVQKGLSNLNPARLLEGLKSLVRPLLNRVLQTAIGRLPPALQAPARNLASRFMKTGELEEDHEVLQEATALPASVVAAEFDLTVTELLLAGPEGDWELEVARYASEGEAGADDALPGLLRAREQFIQELESLRDGEDPTRLVQNFLPAILPTLKLGIQIVGREKVINFLAGYLAQLIGRFTGPQLAPSLSRAIVDAGLQLMTLEMPVEEAAVSASSGAIANTLIDTLRELDSAPELVLAEPALLEAYLLEAFEKAAINNLPESLLKPELRPTSGLNGTWVSQPLSKRKQAVPKYKKYSKVLPVTISPAMAKTLRTFGGMTLAAFLRDQLGLPEGKPVQAKVHLYETGQGIRLQHISKLERGVPGLGTASRSAWMQFHPLTPEAAGFLFQEPSLGRKADPRFLRDRGFISVGQRFYFLEIPGVRAITTLHVSRRATQFYVTLDFQRARILARIYLSEDDAQSVAKSINQGGGLSGAEKILVNLVDAALTTAMTPEANLVTVIPAGAGRELFMPQKLGGALRPSWQVLKKLAILLKPLIVKRLNDVLKEPSNQFGEAVKSPENGVTIKIKIVDPPGFMDIGRLIPGSGIDLLGKLPAVKRDSEPSSAKVVPGYRYA